MHHSAHPKGSAVHKQRALVERKPEMASKQGTDTHCNYMDDVKVKISEQYKPPRRIPLATSYSQRLMLNKQIQDNIPVYDFCLEESVRNRMKEWRNARNQMTDERLKRFEKCKEERQKRLEERLKKEQENAKNDEEEPKAPENNENACTTNSFDLVAKNTPVYISQTSSANMLFPTQVTTPYSNILMPTPLTTLNNTQHIPKTTDKSPFKISDFEADTSSPFDNMELKTLNDMEELAQVLKNDDVQQQQNQNYTYNMQHNQYYQSFQDPMASYSYTTQITNLNKPSYTQQLNYAGTNGYYGSTDIYNNAYAVSYANKDCDVNNIAASRHISEAQAFNAVPNIIKSLESDLKNSHIAPPVRNAVDNKLVASLPERKNAKDVLEDPFDSLSKEMQQICRSISSMGFPLSRVARACKLIGNDHKKIVEHLLVMSELLDLGFSESQVSKVLLECDNDRDKALDVLIL